MARFISAVTFSLVTATATVASAGPLEDRFLAAQEAFEQNLNAFYVSRVPALEGKIPSFTADPAARDAMLCGFSYLREETGVAGALKLIVFLESAAEEPITSFDDITQAPDGAVAETMLSAVRACNTIEISQQLMAESGALEIFSDPATLDALMD
ncbi:MAG: hypothetical protein AAF618_13930 [Pseudomonadota bacterium]